MEIVLTNILCFLLGPTHSKTQVFLVVLQKKSSNPTQGMSITSPSTVKTWRCASCFLNVTGRTWWCVPCPAEKIGQAVACVS